MQQSITVQQQLYLKWNNRLILLKIDAELHKNADYSLVHLTD